MSIAAEPLDGPLGGSRMAALSLRYALRELRGGLRGFYVFIACIALGVFAIAGVGSVAASLSDGLAHEGRTLLGGDVSFVLFQREAKPAEVAFLRSRGEVSAAATLRGMAKKADGKLALVEMKAVDGLYPMLGALTLAPDLPMAELLAQRDGAFGAAADPTLLARLDLKIGDKVMIGDATFQIRSAVDAEPDKLAGGLGFGPRFLVSLNALRATGLLQPGSLVRWIYRVKLPDNAADDRALTALIEGARKAAPEAGWEVRSRANASPQLERTIGRFTQFLTLVGLAALLVGGVGVANAVKSHVDRRLEVIAALKALGATGRDVFAIYLAQVMVLASLGAVIGLAAGAALPFVIVGLFGKLLPLPVVPAVHAGELVLSFVYGLLTALAFGLWPLGRVHDVPVAALFREAVRAEWHRPRWRYLALMALVVAALIAVVIGLAYDKRIAAVFVLASVIVFAILRGIAAGVMALAARLPRTRFPMLRLAISNIYRPGALTPSVASITSSAMSAASRCFRAITTESFSAIRWVLPLRRIPAVSMKRKLLPLISTTSSTASRVVPGIGDTMAREVPVSRFSSVDLPTLGCPIIATFTSFGSAVISASGGPCVSSLGATGSASEISGSAVSKCKVSSFRASKTASRTSSTPRPCSAEIGNSFLIPRRWNSSVSDCCLSLSILLTARKSGLPPRISKRARSRSGAVSSLRPSTTRMIASASSNAIRAWRNISAGMKSFSSGSIPPVSTMRNRCPRK